MGKLALALALMACLVMFNSISQASEDIDQWLLKLSHAKEKVTHLHFYFHDIFSEPNPTAVVIARSNITNNSPTVFGMVVMIDDPLTVGPEPTSKEVGRAQGFYGSCGQKSMNLLMAMNLLFKSKEFNGSSLTIMGGNPAMELHRELPIIGGTGVFRLARGFASLKTYYLNATTGDAIVEYNVTVLHY